MTHCFLNTTHLLLGNFFQEKVGGGGKYVSDSHTLATATASGVSVPDWEIYLLLREPLCLEENEFHASDILKDPWNCLLVKWVNED